MKISDRLEMYPPELVKQYRFIEQRKGSRTRYQVQRKTWLGWRDVGRGCFSESYALEDLFYDLDKRSPVITTEVRIED